jgi:alkyl hydroperoxide reductase subunit AhpC
MPIDLGQRFPDITLPSQVGEIGLYSNSSGASTLLLTFSSPFTPVSTTEMGETARLSDEFSSRGIKVVGVAEGDVGSIQGWIVDVKAATGQQVDFPVMADSNGEIAKVAGVGCRVILLDGKMCVRMDLCYPPSLGRNYHEILRTIDSVAHTDATGLHTPVNWVKGSDSVVAPEMSVDDADDAYDDLTTVDLPSMKGYLRLVADPGK